MGLFLWHFVEEVEHRSSALLIYDAVVNDPWYRLRVASSVFAHVGSAMMTAAEGFNKHAPLEERKVDARWMDGMRRWKKALRQKLPFFEKLPFFDAPDDGLRRRLRARAAA
jgi:predicted metal-dependent hydrolase